ncbi:MAG: redoxin domain-containing protein, partial [Elusimicrobia bacterium]|nr:redoxin domain-containing protein [Elusimicrobiota bacterium]
MRLRLLPLFLAAALAAPAGAARPITPPAPDFPPNRAWLNGAELNLAKLRKRRVVLVAFINTMSMNSVRTFPILNLWWKRYNLSGLMIIGVHTPDFDFDDDPNTVKASLKRFGIQFPVVLDNDGAVWKAFQNEGWPGFYLVDHKGLIVFDRVGEGGYREFEAEIREALNRFNRYWAPETLPLVDDLQSRDCRDATRPVYLGSRRG